MKTVFTKFLAVSGVALLMLSSCKKDGAMVTATSGTGGTISATATTVVLNKAKASATDTSITFNFTKADYGYSAVVTNTLQIDSMGDNWKKPQSVTTSGTSQRFTTNDFNSLLLKLNLPTGKASQIQVRMAYSISTSIAAVYSNVITLTVTPYALISYLYAPGSYQNTASALQWLPATADSLVSPTGNGVYTGYIYFIAGGKFKLTPAKNWNAAYGDAGTGKISSTGGDISAPATTGLYLVTVDVTNNTITFTNADHIWSVIGDAGLGWNTGDDVNMTFNQNANVYSVTTTLKSSGAFKFRADNAWTLSYGDVTPITGQLSTSGANLTVATTGTYLVTLSWGNPLLAPTYKLVKQ